MKLTVGSNVISRGLLLSCSVKPKRTWHVHCTHRPVPVSIHCTSDWVRNAGVGTSDHLRHERVTAHEARRRSDDAASAATFEKGSPMQTAMKSRRVSILFAGRRRCGSYQLCHGKLTLHSSFGSADALLARYAMAAPSSLARALLRVVVAKHEASNHDSEMQH